MTSPLHDLGLEFVGHSNSIVPEGITAHYGGDSPWRDAHRFSPDAFRDSTDHNRCASITHAWHDYHLSLGWFGYAYTSGVCPHGHRYEGRGPGRRTGANGTNDGNRRSYAVVYIAGGTDPVTTEAKRAYHDEALRLGRPLRWAHSDWKSTACPGDPMRAWRTAGWPRPDQPNRIPRPTKEHPLMATDIVLSYEDIKTIASDQYRDAGRGVDTKEVAEYWAPMYVLAPALKPIVNEHRRQLGLDPYP